MENFHLLGSNLHVIWLCLSWIVKSKSIALSIHIFVHIKSLCWKFFRPTPPLVSNSQLLAYPPSGGWRNMWTAPNLGLKQICKVASGNLCMLSLLWPTSGVNNLMSSQTQSELDFNISSFRYEFNIYVPGKKSQKIIFWRGCCLNCGHLFKQARINIYIQCLKCCIGMRLWMWNEKAYNFQSKINSLRRFGEIVKSGQNRQPPCQPPCPPQCRPPYQPPYRPILLHFSFSTFTFTSPLSKVVMLPYSLLPPALHPSSTFSIAFTSEDNACEANEKRIKEGKRLYLKIW